MCMCADAKGLCLLQFEALMKSFLHFDLQMFVTQHLSAHMFHILAVCLIFCIIASYDSTSQLICGSLSVKNGRPMMHRALTVLPVH